MAAVGEADGRADLDAGPGQQPRSQGDGERLDADAGDAVLDGQAAAGLQLLLRQRGAEKCVVDPFGDSFVGQFPGHASIAPQSVPRMLYGSPELILPGPGVVSKGMRQPVGTGLVVPTRPSTSH